MVHGLADARESPTLSTFQAHRPVVRDKAAAQSTYLREELMTALLANDVDAARNIANKQRDQYMRV